MTYEPLPNPNPLSEYHHTCPLQEIRCGMGPVDTQGDCRYESVCPSPCSPLRRLSQKIKERRL